MGLQVEVVHVDVARRSRKRRAVRVFRGELLSPQAWSLAGGFLAPRDLGVLECCHRVFSVVTEAAGKAAFLARMGSFGFAAVAAADFYASSRKRCVVVRRSRVGPALHSKVWLEALDHYASIRHSSKWVDRYFRGRRGWDLVVVLAERWSHAADGDLEHHRAALGSVLGIHDKDEAGSWEEFVECYTEIRHAYGPATRMLLDVCENLVRRAQTPARSEAVTLIVDHLLDISNVTGAQRAKVLEWRRSPAYYSIEE